MNSISTKKKNLVTNSNARKSRKKNHSQYGGSSRVLNKISERRLNKSVPSGMSSISSKDFSSMSLEQKKAVLAERKRAIRTKKLAEKRKKRKLRYERERLKTKQQKARRDRKLAREKAKKKKSRERKKERNEKEEKKKEEVKPGVQQMAMTPQGMGMQQPYGIVPGGQTGMFPMAMTPQGMGMGMGMGPGGDYRIAPGMTSLDAIDESSLEEMVSMLKNFEGNEYQQTARMILGEDNYTQFDTAFNKLQQVIETVYKINKETLNAAIKDRLDRDIKRRRDLHSKTIKAERRSRQLEHLRNQREEERRRLGLFTSKVSPSIVSITPQQREKRRINKDKYETLVNRLIEYFKLFSKYPELFILSKYMTSFTTPIIGSQIEFNQKAVKSRRPNIFSKLSKADLSKQITNNKPEQVSVTGTGPAQTGKAPEDPTGQPAEQPADPTGPIDPEHPTGPPAVIDPAQTAQTGPALVVTPTVIDPTSGLEVDPLFQAAKKKSDMRAREAGKNGLFIGMPLPLKVSKNNGSLTHEGTQFSQQCFWISIVDWILVSQSEETLNKLGIGIPNDFKQSLTSEQTFNTNREFLLNAIKGLTKTKDSQKYRNIIEDTKQTRLDGTSGHEDVIQDFVNKTGLYINVFSIDPRNKNQLSLPEGKENANLTELSIHSLYSIGPEGNYMSPSGGGEGHNSRIFIVAYGYHFELITQYKDYNVSKQATIDQSLQKIIYSVPSWTYAIYKDSNELTDAQDIDRNSSDVIIGVFFDSLVTAINDKLRKNDKKQIYHLPVLGVEFADMLTKLKESEDKKALYEKYSKIYYGGEGNEDSPTKDGLMIQIEDVYNEHETSESPSSKANVILSEQDLQQLKQLRDKPELRAQILQAIRDYINDTNPENKFNLDKLKEAIKQKLRDEYRREQLPDAELMQISEHVSYLLQLYLRNNNGQINISEDPPQNVLKKLGNFFAFLEDLNEEKLALGVVND